MPDKKNAFYAQSGGVTAVINASACGVIETARKHRDKIGRVYAGRNGIIGALTEDMIDTNKETAATIAALRHTPGGAFGSARYKLKGLDVNRAEYERLIEVFRAHNIGYFFYNGGGDSADTCFKVSQLSKKMNVPIQAIHVPKTVDNDLPITDTCPGFGSVAKYVAVSTREAALDVESMARTSTKVFVLEVMGRHAGWIAAAGGLAGNGRGEAPHIILFPEIPFDQRAFLKRVAETVRDHEYCVIVVSEGAAWPDGRFLADAGRTDAFGHKQLGGVAQIIAQGRRRTGAGRGKLGHAGHYPQVRSPVSLEDRNCAAEPGCEPGEEDAEALHNQGRLWHHSGLPPLPRTADRRRGLSSIRRRPAQIRPAEKYPGRQKAENQFCAMIAR
jgi:6-phosphofructokinase 1